MARDVEPRRTGGLRLTHGLGMIALAVVGVVVALWVVGTVAHLILGALSFVVGVGVIAGLVWLVVGRGGRRRH